MAAWNGGVGGVVMPAVGVMASKLSPPSNYCGESGVVAVDLW